MHAVLTEIVMCFPLSRSRMCSQFSLSKKGNFSCSRKKRMFSHYFKRQEKPMQLNLNSWANWSSKRIYFQEIKRYLKGSTEGKLTSLGSWKRHILGTKVSSTDYCTLSILYISNAKRVSQIVSFSPPIAFAHTDLKPQTVLRSNAFWSWTKQHYLANNSSIELCNNEKTLK